MFEKLLGLLPYNPSLIHQVAFYAKRMREESAIRRAGLIFIVLAFFIQFFAFMVPPQSTVANSTNDLINGGFTTQSQAVSACTNNVQSFKTILANYGITCNDIAKASIQNLSSTANNNRLYSMGWNAAGYRNTVSGKLTNETPVSLVGLTKPIYWRLLSSWDTGTSSTYKALRLTSSTTGKTYFILYTCGNLATTEVPSSIQPCSYNSKIFYNNSQCRPAPCQYDASIFTNDPNCKAPVLCSLDNTLYQNNPGCVPCTYDSGILLSSARCVPCPNSKYSTLSMFNPACKPACPYNSSIDVGDSDCTIVNPVNPEICAFNSALLASDSNCRPAVCPQDSSIYLSNPACQACPFNSNILKTNSQCIACPNPKYATFGASSSNCKPICPFNIVFDLGDAGCKPCKASSNSADALACMIISKSATNPTQGWSDANGKTAKAGDTIVYTLNAKNGGQTVVKGFVMQENLNDVLDYATVVDLQGGTLAPDNQVSWPAADISSGATISRTVTVKVKDQIPQTPTSTSDPAHFDLVMTNVYGNSINIAVPGGIVKTISSATTLVNTGPGTSMVLTSALVVMAGYFFARSRLLYKESYIVIHESSGA